jgi:hypothetical protein
MMDLEDPPQQAMDPLNNDFPADEEAAASEAEKRMERLQLFQDMMTKRRLEAVMARSASGVERRWLDDTDSYHGRDSANRRMDIMEAAQGAQVIDRRTPGPTQQRNRSTVFVQLTRQKTNTASARLADMLFPTDDRNWGIKPSPVPELMDNLTNSKPYQDPQTGGQTLPHPTRTKPDGTPDELTVGDLAAEEMAVAQKKAEAMEKEIDDQLTGCQFQDEGRKVIQNAARLGTGIFKGPTAINRTGKKWVQKTGPDGKTIQILQVLEEIKPQSYSVDPWNFYPDPACGDDVQNGAYVYERDYMPGRKLARLAKIPGYNAYAIGQCLMEGPKHVAQVGDYEDQKRAFDLAYDQTGKYDDKRYEIWIYTGEVERDDLIALGVDLPEDPEAYLTTVSAVLVMCNERIIKALLNPMDTGDFPYDVFNWELVDQSPFGVGIPYLMRYAQRTLNAAWRAMLDNMALSSGPQIIINRKSVVPADGSWELTARKLWFLTDDGDVEKAMEVFEIASHQEDISNIITIAQAFADAETSLPQIAQGEKGSAPDSVGGMSMLMNSAGTVLRRLTKQYDGQVTRPHLRRYYDWNMQYNPKEEIKGDFEIDARGSSVLIVRDQQQQAVMQLFNLAQNPTYSVFVDHEKLFKKGLEMNHLTPDDVMNTPDQIALLQKQAQQQPPVDPKVQIAQAVLASNEKIAQAKIQSTEQITKAKIDVQQAVQQTAAQAEEAYAQTEAQMARDGNATEISKMELQREILIMEYAYKQGMQLTQVKAQLAELALSLNSKHAITDANNMATSRQNTGPAVNATPQLSPDMELQQ